MEMAPRCRSDDGTVVHVQGPRLVLRPAVTGADSDDRLLATERERQVAGLVSDDRRCDYALYGNLQGVDTIQDGVKNAISYIKTLH